MPGTPEKPGQVYLRDFTSAIGPNRSAGQVSSIATCVTGRRPALLSASQPTSRVMSVTTFELLFGYENQHIEALKEDPKPGLVLLEPVRSDPSRYVQTAVANWLNDASKSEPGWVKTVCARWTRESPTRETAWTVNHALRTLRKQGAV